MLTVRTLLGNKPEQEVWSVHPDQTVYEALHTMADRNVGALPVIEEGRLAGIFSERDYARKIILQGRESKSTLIAEVMSGTVHTVRMDDSIHDCMRLMTDKRIRHLPVLDGGERLVGILSIGDIVNAIIREQQEHINNLEQYITGY
ncbi:MAG: CBS domain-containing protein [Saprospiraceae bacterium]|nr:CBS domain-containing protein [Saprospiraceae bacterium]